MARHVLIAMLAGAMFAALPAWAQEDEPQLDGGPPPLQVPKAPVPKASVPKPSAPKPVAPKAATPPRVTTATPSDASLKAEQARLARLAADLDARETRLDTREADLDKEEARLARVRTDQDADYARKLAELDRQRSAAPPATANLPPVRTQPYTPQRVRISYDDARRACTRAGMAEAMDNDFYSARYETAPRFFERQRELRGRMRMDDREGHLSVDTVCQLDDNGVVLRFEVLED